MAEVIVETRGLTRHFGDVVAVQDVDLRIEEGELFALIGHNGAGKTTLFRMLLGLLSPTAGEVLIGGRPLHGAGFRELRRRIGYLPENLAFYDNLTGEETLEWFADLKGVPRQECGAALARVGLSHAAGRRVRGYSKGMRQRLGLAQALLGNPRLLFLDEPTTGLDPEGIREFYAILRSLKAAGVTMILSSHILAEIQDRVDRLAILKSGRVAAVGSVAALRQKADLPVTFVAEIVPGEEAGLRARLAGLPVEWTAVRPGQGVLQCPRASKKAVLAALSSDAAVRDLSLREPSLEDVFLGYAG